MIWKLVYRTPVEFRQRAGYANVKSKESYPHLQSHDGGSETTLMPKQ